MNNVAMNIFVCVLGEYIYAFLLGIFLELRFLGHIYKYRNRNPFIYCFSKYCHNRG